MNRNNEIDKLFRSFIQDLMILVKESRAISIEKRQDISQIQEELDEKLFNKEKSIREYFKEGVHSIEFTENPMPLFNKRNHLSRSRKMSHNGNFLYSLALFENFASKLIKITTSIEGKHRERYFEKFKKFALDESEKGNHIFTKAILDNPNNAINYYDELPNPLDIWLYVFNIDKKGIFSINKPSYIELRERRNLLVHRSTLIDERYEKSFLKANMGSDKGQKAKKFLDSIISQYSYQTEDKKKIDLSASVSYLVHTFECLLVMSFLLYINSFKVSLKDGELLPSGLMNDLMCFSYDIYRPTLFYKLESLLKEYKKTSINEEVSSIPYLDYLNMMIWRGFVINTSENRIKFYEKNKNKKMIDFFKKEVELSKELLTLMREDFKITYDGKFLNELDFVESHLDGNIDEFIKNIKKNKKIDIVDLETWFIFKKYQKDKKFTKFMSEFKKSHGEAKVEIKIERN